nr:hypothetical protein [Nostoc linckia]
MPNDATCSTWGDPKTAVAPQCPMPNAQCPMPHAQCPNYPTITQGERSLYRLSSFNSIPDGDCWLSLV